MKICIVIPHYHKGKNSKWLVDQFMNSVKEHEPDLLTKTVLIDDASHDSNTKKDIYELHEKYKFQIIWKRKNTTYADVINSGLWFASNHGFDYALVANNDIILKTPFVDKCEEIFQFIPNTGVIGAKLFYPDGRLQHQGFSVTEENNVIMPGYREFNETEKARFCHGVTGAFQVINLNMIANSYNNIFPLSYEDADFCLRNWEQNIATFYHSGIEAIHYESATRGYSLGEKELESYKQWKTSKYNYALINKNINAMNEIFKSLIQSE